jgi:hypothetical protein
MDPDRRVRETLALAFRKFDDIGSVRQVAMWFRDERIELPTIAYGPQGRIVQWHLPRYNSVHRLLTNPVYAGAYVFGRTVSRVRVEGGRKVVRRGAPRRQNEWEVLIRDHYAGYITWQQYKRNQHLIGANANMKGAMVAGSVRNGGGILVGLLRCGHCGRKLKCTTMACVASPGICASMRRPIMVHGPNASRSAICVLMPPSPLRCCV